MSLLIFANGELNEVEWIRPYLQQATAVWAANGGCRHLYRLEHLPDKVIGDIDSLDTKVRTWLTANDVPFEQHPPEKDETDLELAFLAAAKEPEEDIWLFGALGGRLDQALANIFLLSHPALLGKKVKLITIDEWAWIVRGHAEIVGRVGDVVSLIPLTGDVWVTATSGLLWPLHNELLLFGRARGISNSLTADTATVSLASGILLCVQARK